MSAGLNRCMRSIFAGGVSVFCASITGLRVPVWGCARVATKAPVAAPHRSREASKGTKALRMDMNPLKGSFSDGHTWFERAPYAIPSRPISCARQDCEIERMFEAAAITAADPREFYAELVRQAEGLLAGERDWIANAANLSSLIFTSLPDLNWAGFYFLKGNTLVLEPFQGKPACVRIAMGRGVCGAAVEQRRTL